MGVLNLALISHVTLVSEGHTGLLKVCHTNIVFCSYSRRSGFLLLRSGACILAVPTLRAQMHDTSEMSGVTVV